MTIDLDKLEAARAVRYSEVWPAMWLEAMPELITELRAYRKIDSTRVAACSLVHCHHAETCTAPTADMKCISPADPIRLAALEQAGVPLAQALRDVRQAIMEAPPGVLCDTLWMSGPCPETVVDHIDAALEAAAIAQSGCDFDKLTGSVIDAYTLAPNDEAAKRDAVKAYLQRALASAPAVTEERLTDLQKTALKGLFTLAYAAWCAADDSCDDGTGDIKIPNDFFQKLSDALDVLDELPDDQPGCFMGVAAKAQWALRDLIPYGQVAS